MTDARADFEALTREKVEEIGYTFTCHDPECGGLQMRFDTAVGAEIERYYHENLGMHHRHDDDDEDDEPDATVGFWRRWLRVMREYRRSFLWP